MRCHFHNLLRSIAQKAIATTNRTPAAQSNRTVLQIALNTRLLLLFLVVITLREGVMASLDLVEIGQRSSLLPRRVTRHIQHNWMRVEEIGLTMAAVLLCRKFVTFVSTSLLLIRLKHSYYRLRIQDWKLTSRAYNIYVCACKR